MKIEHKTTPIEHWIVDGKAYRLATEVDIGKEVLVADLEIEKRDSLPDVERTLVGIRDGQYRFKAGSTEWEYAYIQDDSLLAPPAPERKPIDWTKPVRTKNGKSVRVLCTDGPGEYPVIGIVDENSIPQTWTLSGQYNLTGHDSFYDIKNAPQRIQRECWVNVYADHAVGKLWDTREEALRMIRSAGPIACVKVVIDCEEGEGL